MTDGMSGCRNRVVAGTLAEKTGPTCNPQRFLDISRHVIPVFACGPVEFGYLVATVRRRPVIDAVLTAQLGAGKIELQASLK